MALPLGTTGSLSPTFVPARLVGLAVKLPYAFTLYGAISNRPEGTFGRLRYLLGGDRPSQTAHLTLSPSRIHGRRLELQHQKGGIPPAAPPRLASRLLSLPPILYIAYQNPMSGYSKAPRGLSVLVAGNLHLHRYYNFAESLVETAPKSLRHSCRSELTRQGISLP